MDGIQKIQLASKWKPPQQWRVPLVPPLVWHFWAPSAAHPPQFQSRGRSQILLECCVKPHPLLLEKSLFSIQNSTLSLVLRSFKHLYAVMSLCSHCSAKVYVFRSFNVSFYMSLHSSSLWTTSSIQYLFPIPEIWQCSSWILFPRSQEHSVLSYSCDLNYSYEHILKVLSPVHLF